MYVDCTALCSTDITANIIPQDSKKVLWNMHQTLRDDPCRRFTFGFTIENRTMRIWYAGRAEILVSTPFDFMNVRHFSFVI